MDEHLMTLWYEKIWLRYVRERAKEISIHKFLMVMDTFKAHFKDHVAALLNGQTRVVKVPAGCTFKVQPFRVCFIKPFKSILKVCWDDHIIKEVTDAGKEVNNNHSFKLSSPNRQAIINWVH